MPEPDEVSESGNPIYHYTERSKDFELTPGDDQLIETISQHIETHLGEVTTVFHELISDLVPHRCPHSLPHRRSPLLLPGNHRDEPTPHEST